jgi:hypothetical protein
MHAGHLNKHIPTCMQTIFHAHAPADVHMINTVLARHLNQGSRALPTFGFLYAPSSPPFSRQAPQAPATNEGQSSNGVRPDSQDPHKQGDSSSSSSDSSSSGRGRGSGSSSGSDASGPLIHSGSEGMNGGGSGKGKGGSVEPHRPSLQVRAGTKW